MLIKPLGRLGLLLMAGACAVWQGCATQTPAGVESPPRAGAESSRAGVGEPRARGSEPKGEAEEPPPPPEPGPTPESARPAAQLPPPRPAEVGGALARVFKGAVTIESARRPYFVVGDFNGDSSQDLAVLVRPAPGRAAELNDELAAWILNAPSPPAAEGSPARRPRPVVEEGDLLLAVIHGFADEGWRDPQATQTYVLKGAAGERLETGERGRVAAALDRERRPRLRGDVIEQAIGGRAGFLYYDGAGYDWYDPRTYRPPAPARLVHGRAAEPPR